MTTEWTELNTLQDVAKAQADGWEIESFDPFYSCWVSWREQVWKQNIKYRGRPRQPKMKKVKMECWLIIGRLEWLQEKTYKAGPLWVACPAQDIEIEIPEDV